LGNVPTGRLRVKNTLVFSPHPDDESIGCGGRLCAHALAGERIKIVFLTSGESGGHGRPAEDTARVRENEARAASAILGAAETEFWRLPDGRLRATRALSERIAGTVERFRPGRIYVTHAGEMHPDHRAAYRAVANAVRSLRGPRPALVTYEVWTPLQKMTEVADISAHIGRKLRAIRAYRTQCRVLDFAAAMRGLARYRGEMHSWPGGEYAEVFLEVEP